MKGFDFVIHVCQRDPIPLTGRMSGYYNSAAGAYVPMSTDGAVSVANGYIGNFISVRRAFSFFSLIDVYVYRGSDGKCLGNFFFSCSTMNKQKDDLIAFKEHVDVTAQGIVRRILGN